MAGASGRTRTASTAKAGTAALAARQSKSSSERSRAKSGDMSLFKTGVANWPPEMGGALRPRLRSGPTPKRDRHGGQDQSPPYP